MRRRTAGLVVTSLAAAMALAGCSTNGRQPSSGPTTPADGPSSPPASHTEPPPTSAVAAAGQTPPAWLGTRVLPQTADGYGEVRRTPPELRHRGFTLPDTLAALPGRGFESRVTRPPPDDVIARSTWHQGCPVDRDQLAWVVLTFRGFDDRRHTGELLVNATAAPDLVQVFRHLYADRFPIEEMRVTRADELDAPPTGDGNNTESFVCRPTTGGTSYSQHAYGLAIDVNPFQNPYHKGDLVLPELSSSYLDRDADRPGMIAGDSSVVRSFAAVGWEWGGDWNTLKDFQHFSENGR